RVPHGPPGGDGHAPRGRRGNRRQRGVSGPSRRGLLPPAVGPRAGSRRVGLLGESAEYGHGGGRDEPAPGGDGVRPRAAKELTAENAGKTKKRKQKESSKRRDNTGGHSPLSLFCLLVSLLYSSLRVLGVLCG